MTLADKFHHLDLLWKIAVYGVVSLVTLALLLRSGQKTFMHKVAVGVDVLVAVFYWGREGITISSHSAIAAKKGKRWGCVLCKLLDKLDPGHCPAAIQADLARAKEAIAELEAY